MSGAREALSALAEPVGEPCSVSCCCPVAFSSLGPMNCSTSGFPVFHFLPEFVQTHSIESMMPSNHLILCCPFLLLPSIFPISRIFSSESALGIRWPKYWSFSFSISSSNEYSGLISFRMDWFDLLAVQGTLKSLLQHHTLKAYVLQRSAFFMVCKAFAADSDCRHEIKRPLLLSKSFTNHHMIFPWFFFPLLGD